MLDAGLATQDFYQGMKNAAMLARNEQIGMAEAAMSVGVCCILHHWPEYRNI